MAIHLITGIPGHGKTSQMMKLLVEANEENARLVDQGKPPRPIFAAGIDGLVPGLAEPFDPTRWCRAEVIGQDQDGNDLYEFHNEMPEGALLFVDEAWKWFGHLAGGTRKTPIHVLGLAEHRHWGIDFVWTAQGTGQMYPFLRPLVSPHWHCIRRFNTQAVDLYKFDRMCPDIESQAALDRGLKETVLLPTKVRGLFKSASAHTMKARLPWKLWLIPACVVFGAVLIWAAYSMLRPDAFAARMTGSGGTASGEAAAAPASQGLSYNPTADGKTPLTGEEWLARITPRFPGMHESAPVFDEREVATIPRRFCVISGEGSQQRCSCYTEQMTPLRDVQPGVCLEIARWGEYDVFRGQPEPGVPTSTPPVVQEAPQLVAGVTTPPVVVGSPDAGKVQGR